MHFSIGQHSFHLLADRALMLDDSILVLSDTHFGKSASFRARGVPIPEGDTAEDSARILKLVSLHSPQRLIVVGDFLHAPEGKTPSILASLTEFFAQLPCGTDLVMGNHDLRAGALPKDWPIEIHDTLQLDDLLFVHDPEDAPKNTFSVCGHLHPVARLKDGKNTSFRVPCFWLRPNRLILPSFGSFTGGAIARPEAGDRLFVPVRDKVLEIPESAW